ncbi:type II secretion system secretin GspD [Ideonella livida]|uniref:Type IV pilus biogenesis and competence protein PilQ n=1 Tax=Ideonella livida TaxID=2707176 RepID=A0A7C9TKI8_9BURK|nr:type II secretion system secretin GspD [Ideonella livida]NDY92780.1 type II secretion system secretin GspD [Ideonella livida]
MTKPFPPAPVSLRPRRGLAPVLLAAPLWLAPASPLLAQPAQADLPMPATRARAPVTLNFVNAEIETVSRAIGAMLDRQILVDPRVRGQLTITSEKPQPPAEAWRSYLAALRGMGFTVVENAGWLKVVPEAEAKLQAGTVSVGAPTARGDQILTQIFKLNHENPNNLVAVLRPLISANNTINANAGSNSLVITDYADNLQRLAKIISALDQPAGSAMAVVPVQHALASDLAPLVQRLLGAATSGAATPGQPAAAAAGTQGGVTVLVEPRGNALIVRAASAVKVEEARQLIEQLDRPTPHGGGPAGNIWVVHLKNADAVKLAEVLRAAMAAGAAGAGAGTSGSSGGTSGFASGGGGTTASRSGLQPGGAAAGQGGGAGSTVATTPVAASASPSTGGMIQADPATNSLIISASEPVYRQMRQVIDQLDTRRAQIYVESMIIKVDAEKAAEFGIQWQGLTGNGSTALYGGTNFGTSGNLLNLSIAAATGSSSSTTSSSSSALPGQGLNVGIFKKIAGEWTLGALGHFLQTQAGANILSTPNIVALDNEEAKIVIGSNVPFVTGQFTNTGTSTGTVNPFQTIERKDVGITLKIKSQIGEGGTIRMTVYQENSSLRADNSSITDKSSIETTIVVDDGQTMVLGGLLKDEYGDTESRVPVLGDIPVLGALFRNDARKRTKSNLMLFLRPIVIRNQGDLDRLSLSRYESIRALQQTSQPAERTMLPVEGAPVAPPLPATAVPAAPAAPVQGVAPAATADTAAR